MSIAAIRLFPDCSPTWELQIALPLAHKVHGKATSLASWKSCPGPLISDTDNIFLFTLEFKDTTLLGK